MRKVLSILFTIFYSAVAWSADGDVFTSYTAEGVQMTFKVISENQKTCQVGIGLINHVVNVAIPSAVTGTITIPDRVNGYTVMSIGDSAFDNCSLLSTINLPINLKEIGRGSFSNCKNLESIIIPDSVNIIGYGAFYGCSNLTSVLIGKNVETISPVAFSLCSRITTIVIPKSVTRIGVQAFAHCYALSSITVDIDNKVFDSRENCNAIIKTLDNNLILGCKNTTIPKSVTKIGDRAFWNCI